MIMKKYFVLNLILWEAILIMGVVSCKDKPHPPKPPVVEPTDSTNVDLVYMYYLKDGGLGAGHYIYKIAFATKDTRDASSGIAHKEGTEYLFVSYSNKPDDTIKPTLGEYTASENRDNFSPMTFNTEFSFVRKFDAKDATLDTYRIKEGKFTIEANKLVFKGKYESGEEFDVIFEGNYTEKIENTSQDNVWKYEPQTPVSKTEAFTQAKFTDHKDYHDNGTKYLYVTMSKKSNDQILAIGGLGFVLNKTANELNPGSYNVSDSKAEGTLWASIGFIGQVMKGCVLAYQQYKTEVYYIASGNAVVTKDEIKFTGKSHFGSTININYNGDIPYFGPDPWALEPKEQTTHTEDFTEGTFLDYGDFRKNGTKSLYCTLKKDNDQIWATFEFILEPNATKLPQGTYNVSNTKAVGTLMKSEGRINYVITGTALWYWSPIAIYFVDSGVAVVTEKEIKFTGKSHFGSTINVNYKGDIVMTKPTGIIGQHSINRN